MVNKNKNKSIFLKSRLVLFTKQGQILNLKSFFSHKTKLFYKFILKTGS